MLPLPIACPTYDLPVVFFFFSPKCVLGVFTPLLLLLPVAQFRLSVKLSSIFLLFVKEFQYGKLVLQVFRCSPFPDALCA